MNQTFHDPLEAGRDAVRRRAWREAFELLSAAASALGPDDLEALAQAAWLNGHLKECIAARERAYGAYIAAGNSRRAAAVAMELARDHFAKQETAVGAGWLARAEHLLAIEPVSVEHGYLARLRTVIAFERDHDFDAALRHAQQALEIGTRFRDQDLMAVALHDRGRILVASGKVAEGNRLIDEAMVGAVAGELGTFATGIIYCNTIVSCKDSADYRRAAEWTEAAKRWCERQAVGGFPGLCRVYRAGIMHFRGEWSEAEREARRACDELQEFNLSYVAAAQYQLGEIRLHTGDLPGAAEAFRQAHELGRDPQPGRALLLLEEGKADAALSSLRAALADEKDRLSRVRLLPPLVEIAISAGALSEAATAVEELDRAVGVYGTEALEASAATARGALELAQGETDAARTTLRRAWRLWNEVDCPYEGARARMLLAKACLAAGDRETAALELQAAKSTFERLGATADARRTDRLLQEAGVAVVPVAPVDRSTHTFMFTDIVKSTPLVEAIGDEGWVDLLRWHDRTLRGLFARHGGAEIEHPGDGFFVVFDDVTEAVACAVAIQRALVDHRRAHGFAANVRIGLHRATVIRHGQEYRGRGVHTAARIAALAEGGEILTSRETAVSALPRFTTSPPRTVRLKGIADPVEVVAIEWR